MQFSRLAVRYVNYSWC